MIEIQRVGTGPIIHQGMDPSLSDNINGPSLIRVPDGTPGRLGRYYLYFAHHMGRFIRLAYANHVEGPWTVHAPGVLPLRDTPFAQTKPDVPQPDWAVALNTDGLYPHLASPDVRILPDRSFEMYLHGLDNSGEQVSYRAVSRNGLDWELQMPPIVETYMRIFAWQDTTYAMARCSRLMRLGPEGWEIGGIAMAPEVRHVAVLRRGHHLHVLYTRIGDAPEHILHAEIDLSGDWRDWRAVAEPAPVLLPELDWEGAREPVLPSIIGAEGFTNALRDPCLFEEDGEEDGTVWMIYAGGGEHALGLAMVRGI